LYPRRYSGDHLRLNMSDSEDEQPNPPPPPPALGNIKLLPFWPQAPVLWFAQAECTFLVKHVTGQFGRYCHVVAALPHESLRMVADLVEAPPAATAYDDIKNRLVASHQLTDFQKAEKLFQMPALGSRKPSDLMAAMLETCPRGEEKSNLFACIFLQRCRGRSVFCWQTWTTRTPRHWRPERTSCWPFTTTQAPLPPLQSPWCSRRDRRWTSSPL
jgi:hypothetical protein